ncbi:MAG: MgtC/SapB family protein [Prevotella sp.]|nr:MgtC/SapB family protein [Bacteroides sp.]MCM1366471.1 MgtC/SapB family protein [Prevotella sp.]MCM1437049.1 MgtC/SapB family protein [Prevotella sp.]
MEYFQNVLTSFTDNINGLNVTFVNSIFRLILSMLFGMVVGAERKRKGQIAGIRTFALISMGACLAMLLSIYVPQEYMGLKNGDPGRIAAQVITGIGFLGGGAMIQMKGSVRGLTTAAGIWLTAIIGMAVGVGMYLCAFGATILCLLVLVAFEWYEKLTNVGQENKVINIKVSDIVEDLGLYHKLFDDMGVHLSTYYLQYDYETRVTEINFVILVRMHYNVLPLINRMREISPTQSITLSNQIEI